MDTNKFNSIFNGKYLKNSAAANSESTQQADQNSDPTGKYYKYCRNFTDQSNQPKNYLIYHTKDDIIKSSGDIIEISVNGDIDKLTNVNYIKVDDLFAYVIITTTQADGIYDHLLLAKIKNVLEIGAKHMIIARYYNANAKSGSENANNVVSAGVIKKTGDTTFIFNLDSGTYLSSEDSESEKKIKDLTTTFFSNISRIKDGHINFSYDGDADKYTAPKITQVNVNELCEKKKDEVLLVDNCDDNWKNNYKIVNEATQPPNSKSICTAATAEGESADATNDAESKAADKAETLLGKPAFEIEYQPQPSGNYLKGLKGRTRAINNTISNIEQIFYYYKYDRTTKLYKYINSKHDIIITFDTDYGWKIKKKVSTANRGLVDNLCYTGNVNK